MIFFPQNLKRKATLCQHQELKNSNQRWGLWKVVTSWMNEFIYKFIAYLALGEGLGYNAPTTHTLVLPVHHVTRLSFATSLTIMYCLHRLNPE